MKTTFANSSRSKRALFNSAGVAALSMAAFATPALAQDEAAPEEETATTSTQTPIIVTGSRIARPTLSSPVPVTTVNASELTDQGDLSLGDTLNELPSLRSTFSQGNSTRFIGTAGLNILDLRGLGTARTLVLVNGKRHVTALPGDYLVDVNTIPVDLLERVDIVTGGNSAVYGSDAVAGVVNFVLKRDFEGLAIKGQAGISQEGDRASRFIAGTYGKNFADGRGNIAIAVEYAKTDPLYFRDRDDLTGAYSGRCQFNVVSDNQADEGPFGTDGIPDLEPVCGVRNQSVSDGGTIGSLGNDVYLRFAPNGNIFVDVPDQELPFSGNMIGGDGSTLRNTGQLAAGLERYNVNLLAHFDVSDAFKPFIEAKYANIETIQEGQPSFFVGGPGYVGGPAMRCDNAFLNAQALSTLQSYGLCTNVATGTFPLSRFNIDFGGRGEINTRKTYRIVGGVEGNFNDDWSYEVSLNWGRLETDLKSLNNLVLFDLDGNPDGFNLAIDAVNSGGQIVCRVNADADPTNDRPDCVPINVLGYGAPSQEALNFVNTTGTREEWAEEFVALASISGDLSQLFELPGGPVAFALGAEYREERAYSVFDELTAADATFLTAIQPFTPPKFSVKEAFGELSIPLLANAPLAEELTISGAARVSDYNTATGTVWAWNVQGIYAPVPDIRFRAGYATSVRTPTQSDLFSPLSQNFAFIGDPCDADTGAINSNPNRAANCAADGIPTTANAALVAACAGTSFPVALGDPWTNCTARTSSTVFQQGGNPTLTEEKGKSLTLGVVIEPRWIPGLNFTVDYYNIEIKNQISVLGAQTIINNCYDSSVGLNNSFCGTVQRDPTTGLFSTTSAVISGGINFANRKTEGIDFDLAYSRTFDNGHKLRFRAIATHLLTLDFYEDPVNPLEPNRVKSELGYPDWAASANINYDFGALDITWSMRFVDKMFRSAYENARPYTGFCPASGVTGFSGGTCTPGELTTLDPANFDQYADPQFKAQTYHNVRFNYELPGSDFSFYMGVDNLFDNKPPFGQLGTASGEDYDVFGRYFYAGFRIEM
ncbi:MAG: TonB-dependent receptor [Sphingomonadaceae bacterium]|nr:TonB-dependent receptor [Sphingomonadaceae bacterium]